MKVLFIVILFSVSLLFPQVPVIDLSDYIVKDIHYDYDLVSGKVNKVTYQEGQPDQLQHRYKYDADNRITQVETSTDGVNWTRDAQYEYYAHGPLAKTVTGAQGVETSVYAYTLQGWIKGVQGQNFSYALGYNDKDYRSVGANTLLATPIANNGTVSTALFNGNIATWATNTPKLAEKGVQSLTNQYTYDQLNRIRTSAVLSRGNEYRTSYTYDANGNILSLQRYTGLKDANNATITAQQMDNFSYNYEGKAKGYLQNTNKLRWVDDAVTTASLSAEDLEDQDLDNYNYDDIGNLNYDRQEDIDRIEWTVYGKVAGVYRKPNSLKANLVFEYDASSNRVTKTSIKGSDIAKTFYLRDATGNVMSTYSTTGTGSLITLQEHHLYGSNRLGVLDVKGRSYEFTDHLGNVRAVVGELKEVKAAYDYYAFGMSLAKVDNGYRYGFNGQEKDNETGTQDYGMRIYNPSISKFLSVDAISKNYPELSPFQFASNSPIACIDMDGLEAWYNGDGSLSQSKGPLSAEYQKANNLSSDQTTKAQANSPQLIIHTDPSRPQAKAEINQAFGGTLVVTKLGKDVTKQLAQDALKREGGRQLAKEATKKLIKGRIIPAGGFLGLIGLLLTPTSMGTDDIPPPPTTYREYFSNPSEYSDGYLDQVQQRIANGTADINDYALQDEINNRKKVGGSNIEGVKVSFIQGSGNRSKKIEVTLPVGFKEVSSSGKAKVYSDGKRFISPDLDGHNGGVWKLAKKEKDLWKKETRTGSYNGDLSKKVGD